MTVKEKLDLYKVHKADYVAPRKPVLVAVKPATYLAIEGQGDPAEEAFSASIGALYAMAFTIKMKNKFAGRDYAVCKLEGIWWAAKGDLTALPKKEWRWKLLIRTPEFIKEADLAVTRKALLEKGKGAHVKEVRLDRIAEGQCVQMLHVGSYEKEAGTIALMKEFAEGEGLSFHGRHHEIYLSDPRRVAPEKLRTILRMPVH